MRHAPHAPWSARAATLEEIVVTAEMVAEQLRVGVGRDFDRAKIIDKGVDVLIADTAGRLHTQHNLMEELKKIRRVMSRIDENAPHETMLVVDAGTGQNALNQAVEFHNAVGLTGIALTKLDGTAKGGIIFAIADRLGVPIRFIGVGEGIEDLRPFDADEFVTALFE